MRADDMRADGHAQLPCRTPEPETGPSHSLVRLQLEARTLPPPAAAAQAALGALAALVALAALAAQAAEDGCEVRRTTEKRRRSLDCRLVSVLMT